jgi:hypothetical protein
MKKILVLLITLNPYHVYAECMGRGYFASSEEPRYTLNSCILAKEYFSSIDIDNDVLEKILNETTASDKAVLVTPLNEASRSIMRGNDQEYWHFVGDCAILPLNTPIEITESVGHCSDMGPTKHFFLGDYTISDVEVISN